VTDKILPDPVSQEQEYYELLGEFTCACDRLVDQGLSYLVVILCHELYRFLYPVEPYASFKQTEPVNFAVAHIRKLSRAAVEFAQAVTPYKSELEQVSQGRWHLEPSERSTSDLYSELWKEFDDHTLVEESYQLLTCRLPKSIIDECIVGKTVLDMGCGSGRYSIALAKAGAKQVVGVDVQAKSFKAASDWCQRKCLPVEFQEAHVLSLPFENESFDFVFCNGVIHHSESIEQGIRELKRVLKKSGRAFLYLYAAGGIFWKTRESLRTVFRRIPLSYTKAVLYLMGMPQNRFIFCDTWYVPVETWTTTEQLKDMLDRAGLSYVKVIGRGAFDLDGALEWEIPGARAMWGDGEHRYILARR